MKQRGTVAAIDVGSTKVTALVAEIGSRGEARVIGAGVAPAAGLARGVIDNIQSARDSVAIAIEKAEQASGLRIFSAYVGLAGNHISSQNNRGIVAVADRDHAITADDRARALEAAGNIAIPTNRQIVHLLPRGYWVEGTDPVSDPVGMFGARLDAETHIVTAQTSAVNNLRKVIESAGVHIDGFVLEGLASATAVLEDAERVHGVAVVDIGATTTSMVVYDEGAVAHTACLPLAGSHLSQDLARVLRCPWESAEEVKCAFGAAFALEADDNETVEVRAFGTQGRRIVPLKLVRDILQARTEEIIEMIEIELKRAGYFDTIGAGVVFTGGSSQLRGLAELAEAKLGIPARVGFPLGYNGMADLIGSPAYSTSIGLVEYALQGSERPAELAPAGFEMPSGGLFRRIAAIGRALMPQ